MNDESTFLLAMQQHPEDGALRLVFADWLEERGDSRAELIRLLDTLTHSVEVPGRAKLEERLRELLASGVQPVGPFWTDSIGMNFAWIPAGTFLMGSPKNEKERRNTETQHKVTLTKGYWLGIHPVTQASWRKIMGNEPSIHKGDDLPVQEVSWEDCQEFLSRLSENSGKSYRLPSEAEWEFGCRAGSTTPFCFGETISTDQANYNGDFTYGLGKKGENRGETTFVGSFSPNAFGLYDTHGNLLEWCSDWYGKYPKGDAVDPQGPTSGKKRVLRGGGWWGVPAFLRSANRYENSPSNRNGCFGLRAAMTYP